MQYTPGLDLVPPCNIMKNVIRNVYEPNYGTW